MATRNGPPQESYPGSVARDVDSAGVYFVSIAEFEWRPARQQSEEAPDEREAEGNKPREEKPSAGRDRDSARGTKRPGATPAEKD